MADLPEISQNLDDPLPQVDPGSAMVPYRMARTSPGGQPVVTTGYGPRARPPIQPPEGFGVGVGMPGLDQIYQAAFQKLPVDEAVKAAEAATRYQGIRGYQKELQNGANAAQAFAKWGPMLFHQATGIPEAIDRSVPTPITPQQMIQNRLNQQKFEAAQAATKAKADAAKVMTPYQAAEIELRRKAAGKTTEKKATVTVPLDPANPEGAKISGPADDPTVAAAMAKHEEFFKPKPPVETPGLFDRAKSALGLGSARATTSPPNPAMSQKKDEAPKVTSKEQFDALKSGDIYVGKDGKRYRKP